jgi:hypothetical protein
MIHCEDRNRRSRPRVEPRPPLTLPYTISEMVAPMGTEQNDANLLNAAQSHPMAAFVSVARFLRWVVTPAPRAQYPICLRDCRACAFTLHLEAFEHRQVPQHMQAAHPGDGSHHSIAQAGVTLNAHVLIPGFVEHIRQQPEPTIRLKTRPLPSIGPHLSHPQPNPKQGWFTTTHLPSRH